MTSPSTYTSKTKKNFRSTDRKMDKHVNLLYVQDDNMKHFVWIKNLSCLMRSQLKQENRQNAHRQTDATQIKEQEILLK